MARIRTIKPEFFRHEGLQDLEAENPGKYPMMVFAGLFTQCDKNGVFPFKPRTLKLDIFPFLDFDMMETLQLLIDAGQLEVFDFEGETFGYIRTFQEHQRITGKEAETPSKHPEPPETKQGNNGETPEEHPDAREGKGKERNNTEGLEMIFEEFWKIYPSRSPHQNPKKPAKDSFIRKVRNGSTADEILEGAKKYADIVRAAKTEPQHVAQAVTFLNQERYKDQIEVREKPKW